MNDFNDFQDENQAPYGDDNYQRSNRLNIGILIIALLAIGLVWLFLRGSVPGLSPDLAIATKYEDTFTFGQHARYNLLVANLGDAPSVSRLTVMSTLSQASIPETVYAPEPWSCTLQEHSVTCQASGVVSSGQSLPAIEITAQLPPYEDDGSNDSLRICAAVKTLLDTELSNNETCEIVILQAAESTEPVAEVEEPIEVETSPAADDAVTDDAVTDDAAADDAVADNAAADDAATDDVVADDAVTDDAATDDAAADDAAADDAVADDVVADDAVADDAATDDAAADDDVTDDAATDDVATDDVATDDAATDDVATDDTVSDEAVVDDVVTDDVVTDDAVSDDAAADDVVADDAMADDVVAEADSAAPDESELSESETITETATPQEEEMATESDPEVSETDSNEDALDPEAIPATEGELQSEVLVRVGNSDGEPMTVATDGNVFVPIHLLPASADTILTVATLQMQFDPTLLEPLVCNENPDKVWGISVCNLKYDEALGILRVTVLSTEGISGESRAVNIEFQAIGPAGTTSPIKTDVISMVDRTQQPVLYTIEDSTVVIQ